MIIKFIGDRNIGEQHMRFEDVKMKQQLIFTFIYCLYPWGCLVQWTLFFAWRFSEDLSILWCVENTQLIYTRISTSLKILVDQKSYQTGTTSLLKGIGNNLILYGSWLDVELFISTTSLKNGRIMEVNGRQNKFSDMVVF